jgi:hypothetical protein
MGEGNESPTSEAVAVVSAVEPIEKLIGTYVQVGGQQILVGPLGLGQTLGLAHVVAGASLRMTGEQRGQLASAAGALGNKDQANIMAIMALLDQDTIGALYGCFIDRPKDWCIHHFRLTEFLQVIDAVGEWNDPNEIVALFRKVVDRWRPRPKT